MSRAPARPFLLVVAVSALLVATDLGGRILSNNDEARFAVLAQDVLARGDWLYPRLNGALYLNKPVLLAWLIALVSWPLGQVTQLTAVLPSAAAGLATACVLYALGRELFGPAAGRYAALIAVTTQGLFLHARLPMRLTGRVQCRLAVVPAGWSGEPGTSIAVGWDDGPAAAVAVDAAAEEAEAAGLPLHIHHVWSPVPLARYDFAGGEELTAAVEEDERLALARIVRETAARFPHVAVSGELHRGSGGAGILGYASQASLIVVGSHRRSTIGELFAGATSDDLIAGSSEVPVLVTPPASARSHDHQDDDDDHEDRDES